VGDLILGLRLLLVTSRTGVDVYILRSEVVEGAIKAGEILLDTLATFHLCHSSDDGFKSRVVVREWFVASDASKVTNVVDVLVGVVAIGGRSPPSDNRRNRVASMFYDIGFNC